MAFPPLLAPDKSLLALGLMSGTSLDGIDAALLRTDGLRLVEFGPSRTVPYEDGLRESLRALLGIMPGERPVETKKIERALTLAHAAVVGELLSAHGLAPHEVDVVGFHGHTLTHHPERKLTFQIGDGALLAEETGIDVVNDFRSDDVALGGEGAPLVPLYHAALSSNQPRPLAVLNLGGVANITWLGAGKGGGEAAPVAFDTGPGNAILDDWVRDNTGKAFDEGGVLTLSGRVAQGLIESWMKQAYFSKPPPKSLDRNEFTAMTIQALREQKLNASDGAATIAAFVTSSVKCALSFFAVRPARLLVAGGGRHNPAIMALLASALDPVEVMPVESVGWDGDALEAQAFAYLAVRAMKGLPISLPTTTGVKRPLSGGRYHSHQRGG